MIGILIPTVNRAHLLPELMQAIHDNTTLEHHVYLSVERSDTDTQNQLAQLEGDHRVLLGEFGSHINSINFLVAATTEPYFVRVDDDMVPQPGWDTAAMSRMKDPARVVGIDQGNGRTDVIFLVDRRYLQPGDDFFYAGYWSQYCDTEFVERAKAAGVWADAPDALIEHRHFTFGKAPIDINYLKVIDSVDHDRALFMARRQAWAA